MSPDDQRSTALRVVITDQQGRRLRKPSLVRWLRGVAPARARGVLSVALVTDPAMRRINREFAGHDYVTDVLSFPADDGSESEVRSPKSEVKARATSDGSSRPLGDIAIALGRAAQQAKDAGHSVETELRLLALHGLLHLLGYDHVRDNGEMARLEARLRRKGGLRAGLIERAGQPSESRGPRAESRRVPE